MPESQTLRIPFNKPYIAGRELSYIAQAVALGNISSDGEFTARCERLLQDHLGIHRVLLTNSGTSALEMAAMLCNLGIGDEVIVPSFTYVTTASAVARLGATPVFVDVRADTWNLDESRIERSLSERTRAIVVVHYGGVACEMDPIMALAERHGLFVIEDAAHAVNAWYRGRALGGIGHLGCFSFHQTKNYVCGEGGALAVNDPWIVERAEIIRDKGTDRKRFERGEVDRYTWVDEGSSFSASEISCAFLLAQLEQMEALTLRRRQIHRAYHRALAPLEEQGLLRRPVWPKHCEPNAHNYAILLPTESDRDAMLTHLRACGISAVFHYMPLHQSPMGRRVGIVRDSLDVTDQVASRLVRLPFFYELTDGDQAEVVRAVCAFFDRKL